MPTDSYLYRVLRWINTNCKQTVIRGILWRWLAASEDRTRLKQENRRLEAQVESLRYVIVALWHGGDELTEGPLHNALRMTWAEYSEWASGRNASLD